MSKPKKEPSEEEKKKNIEISDTIFLFTEVNEGVQSLYARPIERRMTAHLLKKYGFDKVKNMIAFLPTYNKGLKGKWGKVIKPSQLVEHLQDVIDAKRKLDRQLQYELQKEAVEKKEKEDLLALQKERDTYTQEEKERMRKERNEQIKKAILGF